MRSDFVSAVQGGLVRSPDGDTADRRMIKRKRVLLMGLIVYAQGIYSVDCSIRDLTETGARITLAKAAQLPTHIHLINVRDEVVYAATIVRRNGLDMGVVFTQTMPIKDITDPALAFIKRLWLGKAAR